MNNIVSSTKLLYDLMKRLNEETTITNAAAVDMTKLLVIDESNGDFVVKTINKSNFSTAFDLANKTEVSQQLDQINAKIREKFSVDSKIIGYLYGGYKSSVSIPRIQKYDTTTYTAQDILNTGNKVAYCPGITTKTKGFFEHDNNRTTSTWYWRKFDFASETLGGNLSSTLPTRMQVSAYNMGVGDKAIVGSGSGQAGISTFTPLSHTSGWWTFSESNETFTAKSLSIPYVETTRQALNNNTIAIFSNVSQTTVTMRVYNFNNDTITNSLTYSRSQYPAGLSQNATKGYWVDRTSFHYLTYSSSTILSVATKSYLFVYHFGESHTLQNYKDGFAMAGYDDHIGDYGGGQHGYCQSYNWSSQTATVRDKLAFPQSSGQMVQR